MTSPAQRHKQAILARQAVVEDTTANATAYELLLEQLGQHKRSLKAHKSMNSKNELKAELMTEWHDYIDELTANGTGLPNAIVGQLMVWAIDVGDYERAIAQARYMLANNISMPEQFERDTEDAFAEEMAAAFLGKDEPNITLDDLLETEKLVADFELYDEVKAKLYRAIGEAYAKTGDTAQAVSYLEQAIDYNPQVGCKPLYNKLKKEQDAVSKSLPARTEPEDTPKP